MEPTQSKMPIFAAFQRLRGYSLAETEGDLNIIQAYEYERKLFQEEAKPHTFPHTGGENKAINRDSQTAPRYKLSDVLHAFNIQLTSDGERNVRFGAMV